jgi:hypothetical protein
MTVRLLLLEQQYLHVHVAAVSRSRPAIRRRPPPIVPTADPARRRSCPPPILPRSARGRPKADSRLTSCD